MLSVETLLQDRYRIIRQLGQGGMGAVYEAIDERLDKVVAVKEINFELENSSDESRKELVQKAFKREASSLVKARHHAVPDVTDYFSEFDRQFLVMEFIEGDDLAKMLKQRQAAFSLHEVLPWTNQLLQALDYLHNLKPSIIHRDIKPQNLKLNKWGKIKLLDFGIAKSTDRSSTLTHQTFLGATLNYSPIEQVLRVIDPVFREFILLKHGDKAKKILSQNTDARCDIFALGSTVYHLLTNTPAVDVTKRTLEVWEGKGDPLINPSEINTDISPAVSLWIVKAMALERENRFSTANEMEKALQTALRTDELIKDGQRIEQERLHEEEIKNQERIFSHAKTEHLIEIPETDDAETVTSPNILLSPINKPDSQISDTFSSDKITPTDYKISKTDIPVIETSSNLTESSYIDEKALSRGKNDKKATKNVNDLSLKSDKSSHSNRKYLLILPIVGILALFVFGGGLLGFFAWMNYLNTSSETESNVEEINKIEPQKITSSVEINSNADNKSGDMNSNVTTETDSKADDSGDSILNKGKTVVEPTKQPIDKPIGAPVPKQTPQPVAKPTKPIIKKTPKPVSTQTPKPKPTKDPQCIYTNSC